MRTTDLNSIIDNYINGNIADAKRKAQRVSLKAIMDFLQQEQEWSAGNAYEVAMFLKGEDNYQAACDATYNERNQ